MPTVKNRPDLWRPKRGQWFDARLKRFGNLHRGGPFKCTGYDSAKRLVEAIDEDGDFCEFRLREFSLEPPKSR